MLDIAFYMFATILTLSAVMVVSSKNTVHSVLFLILAFFNAGGLFVLLGAEFLAMILVIVYVGAVAVLFLFVVMMLNVNTEALRRGFMQYLPVGTAVGVVLFMQLAFVITAHFTGALPTVTPTIPIDPAVSNTAAIGQVMYTRYAYIFEVCGLILLVAMLGAIVLTLRHREGTLRQNVNSQIERKRADAIGSANPGVGQGIEL